jgi:outer membrane protein OmpA-like peptidoglycan-associated protein
VRFVLSLLIACGFVTSSLSAQEYSVYFDSNAFLLNETQKATLTSLFSSEEEVKITIAVEGFCDDVGSEESNQILSQKRADEVANFLQNELQLVVSNSIGKGEISLPENTLNADDIRKNNRVVKISFSKEIVEVKLDSVEKKPPLTNYKTFSDELKKAIELL